jgi:hypothetical protein
MNVLENHRAEAHVSLRRTAELLVSVIMLAVAFLPLLGCGRADKEAPSGAKGYKITLWEQMDPQEREVQAQQIAAYQRDHPGSEIVSHYSTEDLRTHFKLRRLRRADRISCMAPRIRLALLVMGLIHPIDALTSGGTGAVPRRRVRRLDGHVYALPES